MCVCESKVFSVFCVVPYLIRAPILLCAYFVFIIRQIPLKDIEKKKINKLKLVPGPECISKSVI